MNTCIYAENHSIIKAAENQRLLLFVDLTGLLSNQFFDELKLLAV